MAAASDAIDLLDRPLYGMAQVDRLLGLRAPLSRWIGGYQRSGKTYPPVVRVDPTGDEIVTWGEFVETLRVRDVDFPNRVPASRAATRSAC